VKNQIKGVRISGVTSVVPSGVKDFEEEAGIFGLTETQIMRLKKDIGIDKRHITIKDECASDLCEHAANLLMSESGCDPLSIDGLLMVTQTPDYFQPATSCVLHGRLGLGKTCATFDINLGCSGYVYGLWIGSMMISAGSCNRVLMLAGDTISRCVAPRDRSVAPLFGDAGSATLIERGTKKDTITFALHSDGKGYKHLIIPAGGFRNRPSAQTKRIVDREDGNARSEEHLYMNGAEIFTFSIREIPSLIEEILTASGWEKEEVDYYLLHQANKFIIKNIMRKIGVPLDKAPYDVFGKYGNQSSVSIPVTICDHLSGALTEKAKKVVLAGFGTGLSWAACTLSLGPRTCCPVVILD
jgi:3-oxoacyl-[acyl-carrier-protein] synthase-3